MSGLPGLPQHVVDLIKSVDHVEFVTLSRDGMPIDTPVLCFPAEDLSTIDVATGLAYPVKAERLRRNSKTGLWIDGVLPGDPTVSMVGIGATQDADIQANAIRYISETAFYGIALTAQWSQQHKSVWYWSRIIMSIAPKEVLWWDDPADLNTEPHRWEAPAGSVWPVSDPAPSSVPTQAPKWPQPHWSALAESALQRDAPGHISLVDRDGFPRPAKALNIEVTADGFVMDLPKHAPGERNGPASLSFQGAENFVGRASEFEGRVRLRVERALPILPLISNPKELWSPEPDTHEALMGRLTAELERRGQPLPVIPPQKPAATPGALRRRDRLSRLRAPTPAASQLD